MLVATLAAIGPIILALNARITAKTAAKLALAAADDAKTASEESAATNVTLAGNGRGDLVHMVEHILKWTETHDERHLQVDGRVNRLDDVTHFLVHGTAAEK